VETYQTTIGGSTAVFMGTQADTNYASHSITLLPKSDGAATAERATGLSMALAELLANAVEHGQGDVELHSHVDDAGLHVVVADSGPGFPPGFVLADSPRLGLRIVDTLVNEELRGTLSLKRSGERTVVCVDLPPEG
jgi:two-component sensor histidine kinase